jgi:hypothetical protein
MLNLGRLQQLHNLSGMWYLSQKQFYQATVGRPWIITCLIFNWNSNDTLPTQIDGNHFFFHLIGIATRTLYFNTS